MTQPEQLPLFPTAPGTKRSRGRGVLRAAIGKLVDRAKAAGCTHAELEAHSALFVRTRDVGRVPGARYVPLDDASVLDVLMLPCSKPSAKSGRKISKIFPKK